MKRELLEKYLDKWVEITLFDKEVVRGRLVSLKSDEWRKKFHYSKNQYTLVWAKKGFITMQSVVCSCFCSSHVRKIKLIGENETRK